MAKLQYKSEYNNEPIPGDNKLEECEREFCVYFSAESAKNGMAEVGCNIPSLTRALLKSKHFKIDENGLELTCHKKPRVVGVSGKIPIQSLLLKSPRKSDSLSSIVSKR